MRSSSARPSERRYSYVGSRSRAASRRNTAGILYIVEAICTRAQAQGHIRLCCLSHGKLPSDEEQ